MTKPSQDLSKLTKQKQQLEAKIQHLQSTEAALTQAIASQQKQLKDDAVALQALTKEQVQTAQADGKQHLAELQNELDALHSDIEIGHKTIEREDLAHKNTINELNLRITTLENVVSGLLKEKRELEGAKKALQDEVTNHTATRQNLLHELEQLQANKQELTATVETIQGDLKTVKQQLEDDRLHFDMVASQHSNSIKNLEMKREKLMDEILLSEQEFHKRGDELTVWQRKLEEQEQNLKVREAQVDQTMKTMRRNSDLLRL